VRQPQVNSHFALRSRLCCHGVITQQAGEVPPCRVPAHGDCGDLGSLRNLARPAHSKRRVHFCQLERLAIPLEGAGRVLRRLHSVLAFELRIPRTLGKEVGERGLQMAKRLLHRHAADFVQPCVLRRLFQGRECSRRFMVAHTFLALQPSVRAQSKHVVVGKARATERASKDLFLLGRWVKPKSVGALDFHSHNIAQLCKMANRKESGFRGTLRVQRYPSPA